VTYCSFCLEVRLSLLPGLLQPVEHRGRLARHTHVATTLLIKETNLNNRNNALCTHRDATLTARRGRVVKKLRRGVQTEEQSRGC